MNSPTTFIVGNIDKSYQVYKAIRSMEPQVLTAIDRAIRHAYPKWIGDEWQVHKGTLDYNQPISLTKKDFRFIGTKIKDDCSYLWLEFQITGEDGIWKLFGLPTDDSSDDASVNVSFSGLKDLNEGVEAKDAFDQLFKQPLERAGFQRKGGRKEPYYNMNIIIPSEAVLKGLENEDWEDALKPIRDSWQAVNAAIDSSALVQLITKYSG